MIDCDVDNVAILPNPNDPTIVLDSELSLFKAIQFNFSKGNTNPNIVLCSLHMRRNLGLFMKKMKLRKKVQNQIFKTIWIGEDSIVESENETDFKLRRLEFESKFEDYFDNTEYISKYLDKMYSFICTPFWRTGESQLTTNLAECMNNILKLRFGHKILKIPKLVIELIRLLQAQMCFLEGAFQNRGM